MELLQPLAYGVARRIWQRVRRHPAIDLEDVESFALESLWLALKDYNPARGSLRAFLSRRIAWRTYDRLREILPVPRSMWRRIRSAGDTPCRADLQAYSLHTPIHLSDPRASAQVRHQGDKGYALAEVLPGGGPPPEAAMDAAELWAQAERLLPEREYYALRRWAEGWMVKEIARHLGLSNSRGSQLLSAAGQNLRAAADFFAPWLGDF